MRAYPAARHRLVLNAEQADTLDAQSHAARGLWNLLHEWWRWGGRNRRPTMKQADDALRQARKEIDWLANLPVGAAQQVLRTYIRARASFHAGQTGPPRFKSRNRSGVGVDIPHAAQFRIRRQGRRWGIMTIPKVGRIRFRWTAPLPGVGREPGRLTGARLVKDPLGWHIVFRVEVDLPDPKPHPGPAVGIDRGVNLPLALSDGNDQTHGPWFRPKEAARLLRLERTAARKRRARKPFEKTSNRLHRTYDQIAALHARAKRRRCDWQHKTTTALAEEYGLVSVEDLRITNMVRRPKPKPDGKGGFRRNGRRAKARLARALLAEAHGRTARLLAYKLAERGGTLVKVPAPYTSQTCSTCGHCDPASRSGIKFRCTSCGWVGHADSNAALNILAAGLAVTGRGDLAIGQSTKRQPPNTRHERVGNPPASRGGGCQGERGSTLISVWTRGAYRLELALVGKARIYRLSYRGSLVSHTPSLARIREWLRTNTQLSFDEFVVG